MLKFNFDFKREKFPPPPQKTNSLIISLDVQVFLGQQQKCENRDQSLTNEKYTGN